MKRLTYFDEHIGNYIFVGQDATVTQHYDTAFMGEKVVSGKAIDKLAAYEDAEEDGRLIVLPCKVGDTIYSISSGAVFSWTVNEIKIMDGIVWFETRYFVSVELDDFGKTVFFTHEEAEAALSAMEGREKEQPSEPTEKEEVK